VFDDKNVKIAQGLFGYCTYDAVQFFETIKLKSFTGAKGVHEIAEIPLVRYRLYQYVIVINHFKDEMYLCENVIPGLESEVQMIESLIKNKDVPTFPFKVKNDESENMSDQDYMDMVKKGIQSCFRGDVFQIVLSRRYNQKFTGRRVQRVSRTSQRQSVSIFILF
jgi:anthranilate synthase component 1